MTRYRWFLLVAFLAVWTWAAIDPLNRKDWLLESLLVLVFVPIIVVSGRFFRLSSVSYTVLTIYLVLHSVGSHYTYSEVPFGDTLKVWFGADRNMYDRLVHFSYGFLLAYPMREIFMRIARARGVWSYFLPVDVTLAMSALYELLEWWVATMIAPDQGPAFLGTQGDPWDAQKDMALAGFGAVLAMLVVAAIRWHYDPGFWRDFREGTRLEKADPPLGEVRLRELMKEHYRARASARSRARTDPPAPADTR